MPHSKWLNSVRGERITFTGRPWLARTKLLRMVKQNGGIANEGKVAANTTVLVRGESKMNF
jgi:hypothetical protein